VLPAPPQLATDGDVHCPWLQQPEGHEVASHTQLEPAQRRPAPQLVASHTHAPLTHSSPAPHGALVPHAQAPPQQRSAEGAAQALHAWPP
jgi:hypothetical protein